MVTKEQIKVFVDMKDGRVVCICKRNRKKCGKKCTPDVVERDKFAEWEDTFHRNIYGR